MTNQIIIIGGGASLKLGLDLDLFSKLEGKCLLGLNNGLLVYPSTFGYIGDFRSVFLQQRKLFTTHPLLITHYHKEMTKLNPFPTNLFPVQNKKIPFVDELNLLTGLGGLSLANYLLNGQGEIYLAGFDLGAQPINDKVKTNHINGKLMMVNDNGLPITHSYSHKHAGQGKTTIYYYQGKGQDRLEMFRELAKVITCKVYNVCPTSRIDCFEKIDYHTMFAKLDNVWYNQDSLRNWARELLEDIRCKL